MARTSAVGESGEEHELPVSELSGDGKCKSMAGFPGKVRRSAFPCSVGPGSLLCPSDSSGLCGWPQSPPLLPLLYPCVTMLEVL